MTTLDGFDDAARQAVLDDVERKVLARGDNLHQRFIEQAHDRLRDYGQRYDYDVEPIIDSLVVTERRRTASGVTVKLEWQHEAAGFFAIGTRPHNIQGQPILSFVWEDPPQWVREQFDRARAEGGQFERGWRVFFPEVDVAGIPESRYIRNTIEWLRQELD